MKLVNFALDFGNGYIKGHSSKKSFVYSSKMGYESDLGSSSLQEFESDHDISIFQRKDDTSYVIGKDLAEAIEPESLLSTSDKNNRYGNELFKRLVDFALVDLASFEGSENVDVRLVTGMPSRDLHMKNTYDTFYNYLIGRHVASKNGKEYVVNVKELKIIEQPLGTLLNEFMNDNLQIHKTLKRGNIVVIDLGSGTTITDFYKNMKRIDGKVKNEGMNQFLDNIAKDLTVSVETPIDVEHINTGIRNGSFKAELAQTSFHFTSLFNQHADKYIQSIISDYTGVVDQESLINRFILTGGGANVLGDLFAERKDNFYKVENPQIATVNGYYKLALSLAKNREE